MNKLRILFTDGAYTLEAITLSSDVSKLFCALSTIGIKSTNSYLVQTKRYFILHARLHEHDGSLVSQTRAVEALNVICHTVR